MTLNLGDIIVTFNGTRGIVTSVMDSTKIPFTVTVMLFPLTNNQFSSNAYYTHHGQHSITKELHVKEVIGNINTPACSAGGG